MLNAVNGIEPNQKRIDDNLFNSLMLVTALNPHIGYDKAAKVAKKAYDENLSLRDAIQKLGYMTGDDFDKIIEIYYDTDFHGFAHMQIIACHIHQKNLDEANKYFESFFKNNEGGFFKCWHMCWARLHPPWITYF